VVDNVAAINRRVDDRKLLQRGDGRLDEEAHEAQANAVCLLEALSVLLAQGHDRTHIDFIEGGQDGVAGL
jgi:hypothetical protein